MEKFIISASSILLSEIKSNSRYMTVSMRMFSTRTNLNHVAVTEAFIDDIIANKDEYICMPLCADVPKLKKKDFRGLTHLYDKSTGTFLTDVIGSFYDFEKTSDEFGVSLIGHARVNKRSEAVCSAIEELYANGTLNFSFEISAGDLKVEDGITIIDASENNELTAMAIVSIPAYPESKALDLVAEAEIDTTTMYENTKFIVSEMDIETVKRRFYEALCICFSDDVWNMRPLLFCSDCVIVYDVAQGITYKAEYIIDGNDFIMKDIYQIDFVRTGGSENNMDNSEMDKIAEVEAEEVVEVQASVDEQEVEQKPVEAEAEVEVEAAADLPDDKEDSKEDDAPDEKDDDDEMANLKNHCSELEAKIVELEAAKAELDAIKAERENEAKNTKIEELRKYAISEGLDVEDESVAKAIAEMNHEFLISQVMKNKLNDTEEEKITISASFDIKPTGGYNYLLGHKDK